MRRPAPIAEPAPAFLLEPLEPLVANAAAHAVASTEICHLEPITPYVIDELQALFHGTGLQPASVILACSRETAQFMWSVTHVPGL
jgi:hypothetical protein